MALDKQRFLIKIIRLTDNPLKIVSKNCNIDTLMIHNDCNHCNIVKYVKIVNYLLSNIFLYF
jgi:hypothetical protein